jgi:hypothetical protein
MADEPKTEPEGRLAFHYIKSPEYREISAHGALGGPTPRGDIWMSLFGERYPIPRIVEYAVAGKPGDAITIDESTAQPTNVESRQGVIRHVEVTVYMTSDMAKRLHGWLGKQIEVVEAQIGTKK